MKLGAVIAAAAAAAPLSVLLSILNRNGWANPEVLLLHSRRWSLFEIPFVGHAVTIALAGLVGFLLVQFIALSMQRFEDVVVESGRLYYATRPWLGETPVASIAAVRLAKPEHKNVLTRGSDNIEIVHAARRGGRTARTVVLLPWFYREGLGEIVANLQACGVEFRTPPPTSDRPIWDRTPTD
jgi:hypothetical protein